MQTIKASTFDLPMPFVRAGLEGQVKELTSESDYKEFSSKVGTTFTGYGFYEGEFVYIPNLPNWDSDKSKRKRILQLPKAPGSKNETGLVSVIRLRPLSDGKFRKTVDWLNTARLSERSFIEDRKFTDEVREKLGTSYKNDLERLDALTGHLLYGTGTTPLKTYVFEDGKPKVDENGDNLIQEIVHVTIEDRGFIKDLTPEALKKQGIELAD